MISKNKNLIIFFKFLDILIQAPSRNSLLNLRKNVAWLPSPAGPFACPLTLQWQVGESRAASSPLPARVE